jgi:hypothetical protein
MEKAMTKYKVDKFYNKVETYFIEAESIDKAKEISDTSWDLVPVKVYEEYDFQNIELMEEE